MHSVTKFILQNMYSIFPVVKLYIVSIFCVQVAFNHPQDSGAVAAAPGKTSTQLQLSLSKSGVSLCRGTTQVYHTYKFYVKNLIQSILLLQKNTHTHTHTHTQTNKCMLIPVKCM